jgi:hypothetical protein
MTKPRFAVLALASTALLAACSESGPEFARSPALADADWRTVMVVDNFSYDGEPALLADYDLQVTPDGRIALLHTAIAIETSVDSTMDDRVDADGENPARYGPDNYDVAWPFPDITHYARSGPDRRAIYNDRGQVVLGTLGVDGSQELWPNPPTSVLLWAPLDFYTYPVSGRFNPEVGYVGIDLLVNEDQLGLPPGVPQVAPFVWVHDAATHTNVVHTTELVFHTRWNDYVAIPDPGEPATSIARWFAGAAWTDEPIVVTTVADELIAWHPSDVDHPGATNYDTTGWKLLEVGGRLDVPIGPEERREYHQVPGGIEVWHYVGPELRIYAYVAATRTWQDPRMVVNPFGLEYGATARLGDGSVVFGYTAEGRPGVAIERGAGWESIMTGELADASASLFAIATNDDTIAALFERDRVDSFGVTVGYTLDVAVYRGDL